MPTRPFRCRARAASRNLGFRVISEQTYDIGVHVHGDEPREVVLHDMELIHRDGHTLNLARIARPWRSLPGAWNGTTEDDNLTGWSCLPGSPPRNHGAARLCALPAQAASPIPKLYRRYSEQVSDGSPPTSSAFLHAHGSTTRGKRAPRSATPCCRHSRRLCRPCPA